MYKSFFHSYLIIDDTATFILFFIVFFVLFARQIVSASIYHYKYPSTSCQVGSMETLKLFAWEIN